MPRITAVEPVLPPHTYPQERITDALAPLLAREEGAERLMRRLHAASGVEQRSLALPLERYAETRSFDTSNGLFAELALDLAERALKGALARAGLHPEDVDFLLFTTVTGVTAPSVDALLVQRAGLRPDVTRLPSFGLGCVAGAAGLARVHDHLVGHPDQVGVLLSVELCSLTLQHDDPSTANLVASGLFGDGAAAVVVLGDERARAHRPPPAAPGGSEGLDVLATRSRVHPDSADALGWHVGSTGFRIVLSADLPRLVAGALPADVHALLAGHGLAVGDVAHWLVHAGGPKVLDGVAECLGLAAGDLDRSRRALAETGNLSSSSVLHQLADLLEAGPRGDTVLLAVGPGVSTEVLLLRPAAARAAAAVGEAA
ncbi:type III polyketide synthase [Kineococcus terrestris]|uniref:type III polyketide synthase n=1 Tax=Kineococcus terrestris TaxID=2044856 RepID=UPI0034DAD403